MNHPTRVHRALKLGARGPDVHALQRELNETFKHYRIDFHVGVDSEYGHHTKKAALLAEYVTGMSKKMRHRTRSGGMPERAQVLIRNPRKRTRFMAIRRRFRRKRIRRLRHQSRASQYGQQGDALGRWDGRQVAGWMVGLRPGPDGQTINWLKAIKNTGEWAGHIYSGYRDPAYSESLCYGICGHPSCPGTCAGRASNHSQTGPPNWGAIDVADAYGFQRGADRVHAPFTNHLPADAPHRSPTGY